jgi:hypothetical protein
VSNYSGFPHPLLCTLSVKNLVVRPLSTIQAKGYLKLLRKETSSLVYILNLQDLHLA